jgi:hypothetical protein
MPADPWAPADKARLVNPAALDKAAWAQSLTWRSIAIEHGKCYYVLRHREATMNTDYGENFERAGRPKEANMTRHTAGPWTQHGTLVTKEGRDYEYHLATVRGIVPYDEAWANARLIAAAPELLEALQWCVNHLEQIAFRDYPDSMPEARMFNSVRNARVAIAKATS